MNPENDSSSASRAQRRTGVGMFVAMWVVVLGMLTLFFQDWQDDQYNPNRSVSLQQAGEGAPELVLNRNRWGHYVANGEINGEPVVFILDTGASDVSVPINLAEALRLKQGRVMTYQTANGPARMYATQLDSVNLGGLTLNNVRASINPNMQDDEVLLGMSFLKHLEFTQRGDTLTLRQY